MADHLTLIFKYLPNLKKMILRLRWENINQVSHIKTPILFIAGDSDGLVPTEMTHRLADKAINTKLKRKWIVPGGHHNDTFLVAGL